MSTVDTGVFNQEGSMGKGLPGVIYVHAHMCLKYNVPVHILKLTSQFSVTFGF